MVCDGGGQYGKVVVCPDDALPACMGSPKGCQVTEPPDARCHPAATNYCFWQSPQICCTDANCGPYFHCGMQKHAEVRSFMDAADTPVRTYYAQIVAQRV